MPSCSLPSSRATSTTTGIMIGSNPAIATDSLTSACNKFHGHHTEGKRERERPASVRKGNDKDND